jgi:hypothetical protein
MATPAAPEHTPLPTQIALALRDGPNGSLEVALAPEELGKVRLTFIPTEQGVTLLVAAERSETVDLLRRSIAELARELEGLGLPNLAFSFAQGDGERDRSSKEHARATPAPDSFPAAAVPVVARHRIPHMAGKGLNLRL